MVDFTYLMPISISLGAIGLAAFFWSLGNQQYDDMDGAKHRIFLDEEDQPKNEIHPSEDATDS